MFRLEGIEWIIYALCLFSVMLLGSLSGNKQTLNKTFYVRKIFWALLIITSAYWIITFPIVNSYYDLSPKTDYSEIVDNENNSKNIRENRREIENLKRELKETREDFELVGGRLSMFLQIFLYGLMFFGVNKIFNPFLKSDDENCNKNAE